jgi:CRP-like cAMP-binding protein
MRGHWFASLPDSLSEAIFSAGRAVEYQTGQILFLEGSPPQGLFGVLQGGIHFDTVDRFGRRLLLHVACPGFWFGGVSAASLSFMPFTARASLKSRVWHVPSHKIAHLLSESSEGYRALYALTEMRLFALVDVVSTSRRPSAVAQIAGRLALLDRSCKESDCAVRTSVIPMTQSELADMTGHSRQTVNAVVTRFQEEGLIRCARREIEILNATALDHYLPQFKEELA